MLLVAGSMNMAQSPMQHSLDERSLKGLLLRLLLSDIRSDLMKGKGWFNLLTTKLTLDTNIR